MILTLVSIDVLAPNFKTCSSLYGLPNAFAHDNTTAEEIALELFNPYPVGISDLKSNSILFFLKSFLESYFQ